MKFTCATCKFAVTDRNGMHCRRYPPHMANYLPAFPITSPVLWCGEHTPAKPSISDGATRASEEKPHV